VFGEGLKNQYPLNAKGFVRKAFNLTMYLLSRPGWLAMYRNLWVNLLLAGIGDRAGSYLPGMIEYLHKTTRCVSGWNESDVPICSGICSQYSNGDVIPVLTGTAFAVGRVATVKNNIDNSIVYTFTQWFFPLIPAIDIYNMKDIQRVLFERNLRRWL